jgi:hypothetical protein
MVEVFKTNVKDRDVANSIIHEIHQTFIGYRANFDLEDCDNILRVKCINGEIQPDFLISFLKEIGCNAEILQDEVKSFQA